MIGETTSTHGTIIRHTASEAHGIGAGTTIHGTTEAHGQDLTGVTEVSMTRGITEASTIHGITADGTTHGTTVMPDGTIHGITCILTMPDGMADGTTLTGDIIITTDTVMARDTSLMTTEGRTYIPERGTAQDRTGYLPAAAHSVEAVR